MELLRGLLVKPNELPEVIEFENNLETKQQLVEGNIEYTYSNNYPDVSFICNEKGKIIGLPYNRDIGHDIIAGPFIIVSDDYENGRDKSLTDNQIEKYKKIFNEKSIEETNIRITSLLYKDSNLSI